MKAKRLPIDPGPAAWNALLAPRRAAPTLAQKRTADWLVIGAGFTGLTAAYRLQELHPKARIVILEARQIAEGPAGRNSGFMIDLPHDLASHDYGAGTKADVQTIKNNRAAIEYARGIVQALDIPAEAFDPCGKINAAATQKGHEHNRSYAKHLVEMDEAAELLDAQQMAQITGTSYYRSGLFTAGTVMLQPALYIRFLAAGVQRQGSDLYEMTPVVNLHQKGADWVAQTPKGSISAPQVILAVNGHANSFGLYQRRLMHVFTYASMTRALTKAEIKRLGGATRWGATPADPLGTTVRRISGTGGDRIVIRNRATFNPTMQVSDMALARIVQRHDASFAARFPMLKGVKMQYRWGGRLCLSRNAVAAFGQVQEGLIAACCQNGLGTAKGTLHGMLAADYATGHQSAQLDHVLAEAAPVKLPPNPLAWLGATAMIKWGEYKAGREL